MLTIRSSQRSAFNSDPSKTGSAAPPLPPAPPVAETPPMPPTADGRRIVGVQIQPEQMKAFARTARKPFEDEMVIHSREFSPRLCEVLGEDQLRIALSQAISKAEKYEFSLRGPIRLFIEASFLFGCGFDTDPQYPWAAEILGTDNSEMDRAERLCIEIVNYQEIVSGQEATNTRRALADLGRIRDEPPPPPASLSAEMELLFPEKTGYLGLDAIKALLNYATLVAGAYSLPPRGESVLALLMFSFGHHCADDPLYRWIRWTLEDTRITRPEARARRLEKKAITWLDHVIAANKRTTAP